MIMISQRFKHALWAAIIFTVIVAIPTQSLIAFIVFIGSFIIWWLVFKTYKRRIMLRSALAIVLFPVTVSVLYILATFGFVMKDSATTVLGLLLIIGISVSFVISTSTAIRIFQTEPTTAETTLPRQILKVFILFVGVGILIFKIEIYLHSMEGRVIATSTSPSEKTTLQIRKSCCLVCSDTTKTIRLNEELHKDYSEICMIRTSTSEPTASSHFRWNSDETIVSWKSPDNSMGEIDLRKDCGDPVVPSSLDDGDPRKFVFVSPSRSKTLFRKITCLMDPCREIFALRVQRPNGVSLDNYHCNLHIPKGTQPHGGSMRTEDIPDNVVIAPIIRWDKNETVIYSAFQTPSFSFDLKEACRLK